MHGNRIYSRNAKFFSSVMKQSKYFDEETLERLPINTLPQENSIMHLLN